MTLAVTPEISVSTGLGLSSIGRQKRDGSKIPGSSRTIETLEGVAGFLISEKATFRSPGIYGNRRCTFGLSTGKV
jgi:hypothetical protein